MPGFAGFLESRSQGVPAGERRAALAAMVARLARRRARDERVEVYLDETLALACLVSGGTPGLGGPACFEATDGAGGLELRSCPGVAAPRDAAEAAPPGPFARICWDREGRRLELARDSLGERGLYYHDGDGVLIFATEPSALLAHPLCPRDVEWRGGGDLMDSCSTFLKGVRALPPGRQATLAPREALRLAAGGGSASPRERAEGRPPVQELLGALGDTVSLLSGSALAFSGDDGVAAALLLAALAKAPRRTLERVWILEGRGRGEALDFWKGLPRSLGLALDVRTEDDLAMPEELDISLEALEGLVVAAGEPYVGVRVILRAASYARLRAAAPEADVLSGIGAADLFPGVADEGEGEKRARGVVADAALAHAGVPAAFRPFMSDTFRRQWEWPGPDRVVEVFVRERELQRTLPLESRIAGGLSIRAPFADPRVLNLARSVAASPPETPLLWRAAAESLGERLPALQDIAAARGGDGFEARLGKRILEQVLSPFLESYCGGEDSMFSADRLRQAHRAALSARAGSRLGARFVEWLMKSVTAAIFVRHMKASRKKG